MNEFESVTASQIDRLVDGELSSSERRALLMSLDRETEGWRRLSLAFLESQAMRQALRSVPSSPIEPAKAAIREIPEPKAPLDAGIHCAAAKVSAVGNAWHLPLAMALCGLVMFGLGRLSIVSQETVMQQRHAASPRTYVDVVPKNEATGHSQRLVANTQEPVQNHAALRLELTDSHGGPLQTIDVPVVENPNINPEVLMWAPPVVSEAVQRTLLKAGRRVHEHRQLYEVTLQNGRHGVLPISEVLVEEAGLDFYQ